MSKLHTSGKDADIKVPYQKPVYDSKVLPPKDAGEFAQWFMEKHPLTFKKLASK